MSIIATTPSLHSVSTSADHTPGQEYDTKDGRLFRYVKAGAADISRGKVQLAPAAKTNHANLTTAVSDKGVNQITVTLGATAATLNEYADGYAVVNAGLGAGHSFRIVSHPAAASSGTLVLTTVAPTAIALDATSKITLAHNAHNGVVEGTGTTRRVAGVALTTVPAGQYGWLQSRGVCPVLAQGAITLGAAVAASGSVSGAAAEAADVTAPQTETLIGYANIVAGVDTEYRPVTLAID